MSRQFEQFTINLLFETAVCLWERSKAD